MEEFYKKKINGLTILLEKRKLPVVTIFNAIKFGSSHESTEKKGISHYIEHCAFKGTKKRTQEEIASSIEKRGGILNGFTTEEFTVYWTKIPSKHFNIALDVLSDISTNPVFERREIEKERKVVFEEIKMQKDTPQIHILNKIKSLLFSKPFGMPVIGTRRSISTISREDMLKNFKSFYSAKNSIVCVVGKAEIEEIEQICKNLSFKNFSGKKQKPKKIYGKSMEKRKGIEQAHIAIGFHSPSLSEKARYPFEIFNSILGEGMSSRLFLEIREKRALAYNIKSMYEQGRDYGYAVVYAGTAKEKIREVKEIILREIKNMCKIEKKEVEEAKEKLIGERQLLKEDGYQTALCLLEEELAGDAKEFYNYEERISATKIEEIKNLAKIKAYSLATILPA